MKGNLIVLIIVLFFGQIAISQKKNAFDLELGYGNLQRQDLSFSPMLHKKWSPLNIYANYERKGEKMNHLIESSFSIYNPSITEPFEFYWETPDEMETSYKHSFKQLEVNYRFLFPVYGSDKLTLSVGGRQRNRLIASDYLYAISSSFSYYFSFGLDASLKLDYKLNDQNRFNAVINTSLFAFNSRSPYLGFNSQYLVDNYSHKPFNAFLNYIGHAKLQSFGKAQDLDLKVAYERILSESWSLTANYYLALNFNQSPTTFASIQNIFLFGGKLNF